MPATQPHSNVIVREDVVACFYKVVASSAKEGDIASFKMHWTFPQLLL